MIAHNKEINIIVHNAQNAFMAYTTINRLQKFNFLKRISLNLEKIKDNLIEQAHTETHLDKSDLINEFSRTLNQIKQYSQFLLSTHYSLYLTHSDNLILNYQAVGPVVVFGASNFPFAYSTAGGDVISALIAGCSVIFKAHNAHIETSRLVFQAIKTSIIECNMPEYVYQHFEITDYSAAQNLIKQDIIKAVSFTGSQKVGRILFDICQNRENPIPFFGELGSINPIFVTETYLKENFDNFFSDYTQSFLGRIGQVCTHPAILCLPKNCLIIEDFENQLQELFIKHPYRKMLTNEIFYHYQNGYNYLVKNYQQIGNYNPIYNNMIKPVLFSVSYKDWVNDKNLQHEIFGSIGIIIYYETFSELQQLADSFSGQLTATIYSCFSDVKQAKILEDILKYKVGRLLFNQMPTGVQVDDKMHHGGKYPASTCPHFTAVGKRCIMRFLTPMTYQNFYSQKYLIHLNNYYQYFISPNKHDLVNKLIDKLAKDLNDLIFVKGLTILNILGKFSNEDIEKLKNKNLKWSDIILNHLDDKIDYCDCLIIIIDNKKLLEKIDFSIINNISYVYMVILDDEILPIFTDLYQNFLCENNFLSQNKKINVFLVD